MENEIEDIVLSEEEEKEGIIIIIVINLWLTEDMSVYLIYVFWENSLTNFYCIIMIQWS